MSAVFLYVKLYRIGMSLTTNKAFLDFYSWMVVAVLYWLGKPFLDFGTPFLIIELYNILNKTFCFKYGDIIYYNYSLLL